MNIQCSATNYMCLLEKFGEQHLVHVGVLFVLMQLIHWFFHD